MVSFVRYNLFIKTETEVRFVSGLMGLRSPSLTKFIASVCLIARHFRAKLHGIRTRVIQTH